MPEDENDIGAFVQIFHEFGHVVSVLKMSSAGEVGARRHRSNHDTGVLPGVPVPILGCGRSFMQQDEHSQVNRKEAPRVLDLHELPEVIEDSLPRGAQHMVEVEGIYLLADHTRYT